MVLTNGFDLHFHCKISVAVEVVVVVHVLSGIEVVSEVFWWYFLVYLKSLTTEFHPRVHRSPRFQAHFLVDWKVLLALRSNRVFCWRHKLNMSYGSVHEGTMLYCVAWICYLPLTLVRLRSRTAAARAKPLSKPLHGGSWVATRCCAA